VEYYNKSLKNTGGARRKETELHCACWDWVKYMNLKETIFKSSREVADSMHQLAVESFQKAIMIEREIEW